MTSFVRRFDPLTARWELRRDDRIGSGDHLELEDGIVVVVDSAGRVAEAWIDAEAVERLSPDARRLLEENFETAWTEIIDRSQAADIVRTDAVTTPLPGEPGQPVEVDDGIWEVPTVLGVVRLTVTADSIVVSVPRSLPDDEVWVRVSESESGTLLALAPLRSTRAESSAEMSFGLELDAGRLHVSISSIPLDEVGGRDARRRTWMENLLVEAESLLRRRPTRARKVAEEAMNVADLVGDVEATERCRRVIRRARRWRRLLLLGPPTLVVTTSVVAIVLASTVLFDETQRDDAIIETPVVSSTTSTTPPDPIRLVDGFRGSSNVTFSSGENATVSVAIDDGTITFTIEDVVIRPFGYGRDGRSSDPPPEEESARSNCATAQGLPASPALETSIPPSEYQLRLVDATGSRSDVVLGRISVDADFTVFSSIAERCATAPFLNNGQLSVDTRIFRAAQEFSFQESEIANELAGVETWTLQVSRQVPGNILEIGEVDQPIDLPTEPR